ncbi:Ca2+-dependent phosphoinositide-specific phospholipase C [Hyalangium gracile]|uniref:Ca2+-dependent phosphoinositide-specific phospholipase C n=1 Tax=Hyalangium gracile TaxID=394092 RepID=UPI001CC97A00|nr:Ca2+-dependent phosphoinositide-specific phospholipase C [Hyalangium gracile]
MPLRLALLLALGVLFASTSVHAQPAYNELRQKSSHNSYQRHEALLDQLVYHRIRSIELDIHTGKDGRSKMTGDWFVYHDDGEPETTYHRLSDCLAELRAFNAANPRHEVVTVWIDLKDDFEGTRMPQDLDALLIRSLPPDSIFTPEEVMERCPGVSSLQAALTGACTWPTHEELRGRFIFALTGGSATASKLGTYAPDGATALTRQGFIAPDLRTFTDISARQHVVFFNMENAYSFLATHVHLANFIGRVWGVNDSNSWTNASAFNAHHIATDKVNYHVDPWAVTHNSRGWPFQCLEGWPCGSNQELVDVIGTEVDSGDIWSGSDSFFFAHESNSAVTTTTWTTSVSTPNSHVEEWGKACLMARAGTAANARYFAVCRASDNHKLRIQYRTATGGASSSAEVDIVAPDTVDQESLTFIRLTVQYDGTQTCATGHGSQNGSTWMFIGSKCISGLLGNQGLAVSSHGSGRVKLLFSNVKRGSTLYRAANFPNRTAIGGASSSRIFDGFF